MTPCCSARFSALGSANAVVMAGGCRTSSAEFFSTWSTARWNTRLGSARHSRMISFAASTFHRYVDDWSPSDEITSHAAACRNGLESKYSCA
jgi:hypothetical protein